MANQRIQQLATWYDLSDAPFIRYEKNQGGSYDRIMVCIEFVRSMLYNIYNASNGLENIEFAKKTMQDLVRGDKRDDIKKIIHAIRKLQPSARKTETEIQFIKSVFGELGKNISRKDGITTIDSVHECDFYNSWKLGGNVPCVKITGKVGKQAGVISSPLKKFIEDTTRHADQYPTGVVMSTTERAIGIVMYDCSCVILAPFGYILNKNIPCDRESFGPVPVLVIPTYDSDILRYAKHLLVEEHELDIDAVKFELDAPIIHSSNKNEQKEYRPSPHISKVNSNNVRGDVVHKPLSSLASPLIKQETTTKKKYSFIQKMEEENYDDDDPLGFEAAVSGGGSNIKKNNSQKKKRNVTSLLGKKTTNITPPKKKPKP